MTNDRYRVAIHEAGHAVCALRLEISFDSVTINQEGEILGEVKTDDICRYNPKSRADAMAAVIFSFGGYVAELLYSYDIEGSVAGAEDDLADVMDILRPAFKTDKECLRRWHRAHVKTFKLLSKPETWAIVEKLAAALIEKETLTFEEAIDIAFGASKKGARNDRPGIRPRLYGRPRQNGGRQEAHSEHCGG